MTPKQTAQQIILAHFRVGSLTYHDAIKCAIVTAQYCHYNDVITELKDIEAQQHRIQTEIKEGEQC